MTQHAEPDEYSVAGAPVIISDRPDVENRILNDDRRQVFLICDENTARDCLPIIPAFSHTAKATIVIEAGEQHKTLSTCESVWRTLAQHRADRNSLIVNLGGGVVTDLGGFCAATYMRGIDFVHLPTTLLGMCDASLGGKHGVDFEGLKNYIGVIAQPTLIWINPVFLETLPERQLRNGMAEIIKHALIGDKSLYQFLGKKTATDITEWISILRQSVQVKRAFVDGDIHEHGKRAALNFGHTFGHALESFFLNDKTLILHGECVALGMIIETWLGHLNFGRPSRSVCRDISKVIQSQIPVDIPREVSIRELLPYLRMDKKQRDQSIRFSLIRAVGEVETNQRVDESVFSNLIDDDEIRAFLPWLTK